MLSSDLEEAPTGAEGDRCGLSDSPGGFCWLGSGRRRATVPSDGQFDCCVCDSSGVTLLRLWPKDLVALRMRRRLGGDGRSSPAVATVIIRIAIIKLMTILRIKIRTT